MLIVLNHARLQDVENIKRSSPDGSSPWHSGAERTAIGVIGNQGW